VSGSVVWRRVHFCARAREGFPIAAPVTWSRHRRRHGFRIGRAIATVPLRATMPGTKWWTLDDDKRLMELKAASLIEIANALGRTEAAVKVRAHILKVKGQPSRLIE
jgi:hypothetical protein